MTSYQMTDSGFNFPKPFQFQPDSRQSARRLTQKQFPNRIQDPQPIQYQPALVVKPTTNPTPAPPRRISNNQFRNLQPKEIQQIRELEEMGQMDLNELMQPKKKIRQKQVDQTQVPDVPVQFIRQNDDQERDLANKMQILVQKLKQYKQKLKSLRDKNLQLAKTSYQRSQDIQKLKYQRQILQEQIKSVSVQGKKGGQFAIIAGKAGGDDQRRRLQMKRELMLGIALVQGDFNDFIGKQKKQQNICQKIITKIISFFSWFVLLKGSIKRIQSRYDKSISSYFSFFKFLVNLNLFIFAIYSYLLVVHILSSDQQGQVCASSVPCWAFYSSFDSDQAFVYSLSIVGLVAFTVVVAIVKWVRTDGLRRRAQIYGGSDIKLKKFAATVFNSWNWSIKTETDAVDQVLNTANLLTTSLKDEARQKQAANRSAKDKTKLLVRRIIGSIFFVIVLIVGWILIILLVINQSNLADSLQTDNDVVTFFLSFIPKLGVSFVNAFFPAMTIRLTALQGWDSPSFIVKIQIVRMYMAKILNVILYAVLNLELAVDQSWFGSESQIKFDKGEYGCRENQAGFNLVLLVLSQTVVSKIIPLIMAGLNKAIGAAKKLQVWKKEIKVAQQVINLIYFQSLVWVTYPLFPYVAFLSPIFLYLDFKFQYWRLRNLQIKPAQQTQASDIVIFIIRVFNITMMVAVIYLGYFLTQNIEHQSGCGPYADGEAANEQIEENMTSTVVLNQLWTYAVDFSPFFWVVLLLAVSKLAFLRNHLSITLSYMGDREIDTSHQIQELQRTVTKLQKQINLNKKLL